MPYIKTETVKKIREQIKKEFPYYTFSISRKHYSCVEVAILSGPIEIKLDPEENGYRQVNEYYIEKHYEDQPEVKSLLLKIRDIMNQSNGVLVEDSDYGTVPDYYTHIHIGKWNQGYIQKNVEQMSMNNFIDSYKAAFEKNRQTIINKINFDGFCYVEVGKMDLIKLTY